MGRARDAIEITAHQSLNIPEREKDPMFEAGEQFQVTGRSLLLFVLENGAGDKQHPLPDSPQADRRRSDDPGRSTLNG